MKILLIGGTGTLFDSLSDSFGLYLSQEDSEALIMKKVSTISLVCAIVLIVAAIVLNVFGFTYINGMRVVRHVGYGYMQMSYYNTSSSSS